MARQITLLALAFLAGTLALTACSTSHNPPGSARGVNADALYVRLGSEMGLRNFVDALFTKITQDERINTRFKSVDAKPFKARLVAFLGEATGGPQVYTGKDMKSAHKGQQIATADWQAFMEDVKAALAAQKVPALEQQELLVILEPMKRDIVSQ